MLSTISKIPGTPDHMVAKKIAIIGGGFSGALMAINLVRNGGPKAILIERKPVAGRGLAYSTSHEAHLLNVRASNMSAFPDQPDHFVAWLSSQGTPASDAFVPRALYGQYLSDLLAEAKQAAPERLEICHDEAIDIALASNKDPHEVTIQLKSGTRVNANTAILALGNLPPLTPEGLDPAELGHHYIADPWSADLTQRLGDDDDLLVIGTGLTMVDVVLLLDEYGFKGRITAISRRGLVPRVHGASTTDLPPLAERPKGEITAMLRMVRARSDLIGWRAAIDELRPFTQAIWQAASETQKLRFLRHLRPWWDVHRHRLAPVVAERIEALRGAGRLRVIAGRTQSFRLQQDHVEVSWLPRGSGETKHGTFARVINCTGPQSDPTRTHDQLVLSLVANGLAQADALGLGLAVDSQGHLLSKGDKKNTALLSLGPMTRGTFWEITAVPDIRKQVWDIARRLSNAHWVGGEGL